MVEPKSAGTIKLKRTDFFSGENRSKKELYVSMVALLILAFVVCIGIWKYSILLFWLFFSIISYSIYKLAKLFSDEDGLMIFGQLVRIKKVLNFWNLFFNLGGVLGLFLFVIFYSSLY